MIASVLRFLFPSACFICAKKDASLCDRCVRLLTRSLSVPESFITSAFDFRDQRVKRAIHAIKYYHRTDLVAPLASILAQEVAARVSKGTFIVPIPMPYMRKLLRGYNQAELIADKIGKHLLLPVRKDILVRSLRPARQVTLPDRQSRLRNQKGSFAVHLAVQGMNILLVDDVTTTGATLLEAKKVLEQNGARVICAATLAH